MSFHPYPPQSPPTKTTQESTTYLDALYISVRVNQNIKIFYKNNRFYKYFFTHTEAHLDRLKMKLSSVLIAVYSLSGITDAKRRTKNRLLPYVTEDVKYEDLLDELQLVELDGVDANNTNRFIPSDRYIWQWPQCNDFKCSNHIKTEQDIQIACKYLISFLNHLKALNAS